MTSRLLFIALCALCSACAARPEGVQTMAKASQTQDRLEPYNRSVMKLNSGLTKILIKPVVTIYRTLLPKPVRQGITNISTNAKAPLVFVHDILQGEGDRAAQTLGRFLMNSTVGIGGSFDLAAKAGVPPHDEDAGQTFARWGIPSGPYIMLPLLGPSTVRDSFGFAADIFADPLRYVLRSETLPIGIITSPATVGVTIAERNRGVGSNVGTGLMIASALSQLDQNIDRLDELQRGALDPYVALREAYRQYRQAEIDNGKPPKSNPEDDPLADVLDAPQ
jgi:phospholipid-binding lipoprotein MlaA